MASTKSGRGSWFRNLLWKDSDPNDEAAFNPDPDHSVERRFHQLIGRGIETHYKFFQKTFRDAISFIHDELHTRSS